MVRNIYKGWKTTIMGILLFLAGLAYVFLNATPDYVILSILLVSGVAMLFFPDNLIEQLKEFVKTKSKQ